MIYGVLALLGVVFTGFAGVFGRDLYVNWDKLEKETSLGLNMGFGLVTDFFDTLGIGNFAPTTALFRGFKQVKDRLLPGTLNVSHTIPVGLEAFLFLTVIKVEFITLTVMIVSAVIGAVLGAGLVVKFQERTVQLAIGVALLVTVFFMISGQLGWLKDLGTGDAIGLRGVKLIIGGVVNFFLGAFMTVGVGLYAPCMALVYMLGMTPAVAFPIMMGSCAFLMPLASAKFVKAGAYNRKASLGITAGGIFGVLLAVYIVKSLPLAVLTWLVIVIILITALTLIRTGIKGSKRNETRVGATK
jgi:uncharacterized membrane protein YfcA